MAALRVLVSSNVRVGGVRVTAIGAQSNPASGVGKATVIVEQQADAFSLRYRAWSRAVVLPCLDLQISNHDIIPRHLLRHCQHLAFTGDDATVAASRPCLLFRWTRPVGRDDIITIRYNRLGWELLPKPVLLVRTVPANRVKNDVRLQLRQKRGQFVEVETDLRPGLPNSVFTTWTGRFPAMHQVESPGVHSDCFR